MRVKKYLALTLAAALATCLLTACPWDIEDDAASSPSSVPSSSSRPSHDGGSSDDDNDSSSAPSSPSTPDEPEITVDASGALQLPANQKTLSAADIEDIKGQIVTVELNGVTVQQGTFAGCPNLTTVTITGGTLDSGDASSIDGPFNNCDKLETVTLDGVTIKGHGTFYGCESLETVTLGGVTINGYGTFYGCESLKEVNLTGVKFDDDEGGTFKECSALTTVTGANTLETIPQSMFADCSSLRYIDISKATSIGQGAFVGCNKLEYIRVGAGLQKIGVSAFRAIASGGKPVPMELTVHCKDSKNENPNLENLFKDKNVCGETNGYPKFEYGCDETCWNQIVSQNQPTVPPDAGNALARYLLDLRL